jgi:16S rRNA (guanine527-N7)-methyltransferase
VTLAESQGKKAAFLHEALRVLGISANVHSGRAEALRAVFDCVTLRAVDKMEPGRSGGFAAGFPRRLAGADDHPANWRAEGSSRSGVFLARGVPLPGSEDRVLALGEQRSVRQLDEGELANRG